MGNWDEAMPHYREPKVAVVGPHTDTTDDIVFSELMVDGRALARIYHYPDMAMSDILEAMRLGVAHVLDVSKRMKS